MNNSANITRNLLIVVFAGFLAIWLGFSVVTSQTETVLNIAAGCLLTISLLLGRRIWLLMVFFMALDIPLIKGLSTSELGQFLFLGFSLILFLMRRLKLNPTIGELEVWMLLLALIIVQVYLRNPVGLNIFGGASVGARPYVFVTLAFVVGWLLSVQVVPSKELRLLIPLTIIGSLIGIPAGTFRISGALASQGVQVSEGRISWLGSAGTISLRWLSSRFSPLKACVRPLLALAFLASVIAVAGSGFRNNLAQAGLLLIFAIFYHQGLAAMVFSSILAALLIAVLAGVNLVMPLPGTVQRALSPFPGTWEERYIEGGELSTEWRVTMWKEALFTDNWIHNKTLGDGMGFTREELDRMQTLDFKGGNRAGSSGLTIQQENMMLAGGYHSGPVQTIRTVGYVGLAVLLLAMIRMATHAHRLILRCKGTEWFPLALFYGLPLLTLPISFVFIFGEFGAGVTMIFLGFGMIRLIDRNLPIPALARRSRESIPLATHPRLKETAAISGR